MKNLQKAFAFDIHVRRDVDEKWSAEGIKVIATDIQEGVIYQANGVTVMAFLVDHGPVKPAFGYRVDYQGRSVVLSGDTKPSENLIKFAKGVDLLIHEVGRSKQDSTLVGQAKIVAAHHTDPLEAGRVFEKVGPKLAIFSHYNGTASAILPLVRQNYAGPVEFDEDGMTIDVAETIDIHRFTPR